MEETKYYIPRFLNEPKRFILFTLDELIGLILALVIFAWILDALIIGLIMGSAIVMGLKKIKGEEGLLALYAIAYWYLPRLMPYRLIPASYLRHWVG